MILISKKGFGLIFTQKWVYDKKIEDIENVKRFPQAGWSSSGQGLWGSARCTRRSFRQQSRVDQIWTSMLKMWKCQWKYEICQLTRVTNICHKMSPVFYCNNKYVSAFKSKRWLISSILLGHLYSTFVMQILQKWRIWQGEVLYHEIVICRNIEDMYTKQLKDILMNSRIEKYSIVLSQIMINVTISSTSRLPQSRHKPYREADLAVVISCLLLWQRIWSNLN